MNGFANAILTLLLSWMRVLVNDLWRLLSSEDAGLFYRFLAANWKVIVLILCAGGFVIDRIIYLIRWRPYYVWSSRLGRLKRARAARHGDVYPEEDAIPRRRSLPLRPTGRRFSSRMILRPMHPAPSIRRIPRTSAPRGPMLPRRILRPARRPPR